MPSKRTFGEFALTWLKEHGKPPDLSPNAYRRYTQIIDLRLKPWLGGTKLCDLKPSHIRQVYQRLAAEGRMDGREGPLAKGSIVYHQRVLHRLLQAAMEDELVARNVADLVKPILPAREEGDDPGDLAILTPEQVVIMDSAVVVTPYYTLLYLEVRTGLRCSEILALRWMDLDLEKGTLSVNSITPKRTDFPLSAKNEKEPEYHRHFP